MRDFEKRCARGALEAQVKRGGGGVDGGRRGVGWVQRVGLRGVEGGGV